MTSFILLPPPTPPQQFLTFVITLERPEKPIDFMIELVRSIKRLADIRDTTSLKMSEVEDYINTFERNPA